MTTIDTRSTADPAVTARLTALRRITAVAGIASFVLLTGSQFMMSAGATEPSFDAPASEIVAYLTGRDPTLQAAGSYLFGLGVVCLAVFVTGTVVLLHGVEPAPRWRSVLALVAGTSVVGAMTNPGADLAAFRIDEGLDPQIARLTFDLGSLSFANGWLTLGTFAAAAGLAVLAAGMPRWLGWWPVVAGVGLVLARTAVTSDIWLLPYFLFWAWVVAFGVRLLRRPLSAGR
jgi:hypothetical protein